MNSFSRRKFVSVSGFAAAASLTQVQIGRGEIEAPLAGRLYKTLKIGMIKEGESLTERFRVARDAGFEGVELNLPLADLNVDEVRSASAESGLIVDGSVVTSHWKVRHSDPDPAVREQALSDLLSALEQTAAVGGHTVLLVVGHGKDGTVEEVSERSIANIRQAIPLAARLGVAIAIENVWNHFGYEHDGPADQSADAYAAYVDAFSSPWVGMQFDIGNHWKYGPTGDWIRSLGDRIIKLDVKGFSREKGKFTNIGEGDIDFVDVRRALREIDFHGWCAAEVAGGDAGRLAEVSANMDAAFGLV
ncbi:MAG: sugar phosphate isomerase/epimerase family protein [Verrucomicrobiota bacterium]